MLLLGMIFKTTHGKIIGEVPDDVGMEIMENWRQKFYSGSVPIGYAPEKQFSQPYSMVFIKKEVDEYYLKLKINKTVDIIIETL